MIKRVALSTTKFRQQERESKVKIYVEDPLIGEKNHGRERYPLYNNMVHHNVYIVFLSLIELTSFAKNKTEKREREFM